MTHIALQPSLRLRHSTAERRIVCIQRRGLERELAHKWTGNIPRTNTPDDTRSSAVERHCPTILRDSAALSPVEKEEKKTKCTTRSLVQ